MSGKRIISIIILILALAGAVFYASTFSSSVKFSSPFTFLAPKPTLSLLVAGDVMLDRNVRNKIDILGFDEFFKGIKDLILSADVSVANLEGPFTMNPSKTSSLASKELVFTFDPALVPKLAELGFDVFGLANNHMMNFGRAGFASTKEYLRDANISYYGDPNNKDGLSVIMEKKGIRLGFVGFHEFTYINFDKVLTEIDRIRPTVDFIIVSPHWGVEYQKEPTDFMQKWGHLFIDHGADVVIGAHTHIIGDIEDYKDKKIFYSLGNFVFDQYFSAETSEGLVVNIALEKDGDKINPTYTLTKVAIGREGVTVSE